MSPKATAVTVVQAAPLPVLTQHNEVLAVLQMIERAAKDPTTDVNKLEKLFELRERVREQVARDDFVAALNKVSTELPVIRTQGRIDYGKGKPLRYARWEDINEAIKPVLSSNGFALSFEIGYLDGKTQVTAVLDHIGGHQRSTTITLPNDASGGKGAVQGVGSTVSYGKRYTTAALLNLTWGGEDDDGNSGKHQPIDADQLAELMQLLAMAGSTAEKLAMAMGADTLEALPASKFDAAKAKIAAKHRKAA